MPDRHPGGRSAPAGRSLRARANLITNGSFEIGGLSGWSASGNVIAGLNNDGIPQDGVYFADFNGGNTTPNGVLSQAISVVDGQYYELSFYFQKYALGTGTASLDVSVIGASTLLSENVSDSTGTVTPGTWGFYSYGFVADSSTLTLSFQDASDATVSMDVILDNVVLIPEPGTALLMSLGLLALSLRVFTNARSPGLDDTGTASARGPSPG